LDERQLVRKILAGDKAAKGVLYSENAKRLYPVCVHFLGYQDPEAEDIVQETFLIAFKKMKEFEHRSSLYTWLCHISVNLCHERLRRRKRVLATLQEDLERFTQTRVDSLERQEQDERENKARLEMVERLMQSMSERCRRIIELRDRNGESYINLARILKIPPGTVMSQLARCRQALKQLLEVEMKGVGS
jgi:RNA polymerase sigma-70 factor (ECF subfamily)